MFKYTSSEPQYNSVKDMLTVLKQADENSVVMDELGRPLAAYLNLHNMSIVMVVSIDEQKG